MFGLVVGAGGLGFGVDLDEQESIDKEKKNKFRKKFKTKFFQSKEKNLKLFILILKFQKFLFVRLNFQEDEWNLNGLFFFKLLSYNN